MQPAIAVQGVQIRLVLPVQAVVSNVPVPHAPAQLWQAVPSKNRPGPHIEHCESVSLVQLTVAVQFTTGVHESQVSQMPSLSKVPQVQLPHC